MISMDTYLLKPKRRYDSCTKPLFLSLTLFTVIFVRPSNPFSIPLSPHLHAGTSTTALKGYLDNLSPPPPSNDGKDESHDDNVNPKGPFTPKQSSSGGGLIPSGRGPLGSYLDAVTGTSPSSNKNDQEEEMPSPPPEEYPYSGSNDNRASGSGAYLSNFLNSPNTKSHLNDDSRTDIRNLLTQRSIQSFMRLCEECRDPHSAKWIQEDFLHQEGNLLNYHGTGAMFLENFGGTWDAPLLAMTQETPTKIVVSSKRRGRGHGGWSKYNPYLEERWVKMTVNIDPTNLASRILSVREQIGKEWLEDLNVLKEANDVILKSFFERTKEVRETDERKAAYLVSNNSRYSVALSSPFRRSNFDLVYNLCTQAAIHRILREKILDNNYKPDPSFDFFRDFYRDHAAEYFDGDLGFGRADDFIEDLLQTSPSISRDGAITDPIFVAELIIQKRRFVAEDWMLLMERVPEDHFKIRQRLFSNQFLSSPASDNLKDGFDASSFQ